MYFVSEHLDEFHPKASIFAKCAPISNYPDLTNGHARTSQERE